MSKIDLSLILNKKQCYPHTQCPFFQPTITLYFFSFFFQTKFGINSPHHISEYLGNSFFLNNSPHHISGYLGNSFYKQLPSPYFRVSRKLFFFLSQITSLTIFQGIQEVIFHHSHKSSGQPHSCYTFQLKIHIQSWFMQLGIEGYRRKFKVQAQKG